MAVKGLFSKTTPFVWGKLLLGVVMILIAAALLAGFMALGWLFGTVGLVIMGIVWIAVVRLIWYFIMHYVGYLLKAGHVAVIAEACRTGRIPPRQVSYGKKMVRKRFLTSSAYFLVDKLVDGAVKDVQRGVGKLGNTLDFIPGMEAVTGMAQFFVKISLGYIDECCLSWTFYNKEQNVFKSAADGVVLYAQNWKTLLKKAAGTMIKVILLTIVIALMIFVPIGILFRIMEWNLILALLLALFIAWVVKFAVMDSYIMVLMMGAYMNVAPNTTITFDLYAGLCNISAKFKELFDRGQAETPREAPQGGWNSSAEQPMQRPQTRSPQMQQQQGQGMPRATARPQMQPMQPQSTPRDGARLQGLQQSPPIRQPAAPQPQPTQQRPIFCGQCGAKNDRDSKFCGACGARLQ